MKILIATESYYPNIDGGAIAQHNLALELSKHGHDVHIIAPGTSLFTKIEKENKTTVYRIGAIKLPFYMKNRYYFSPFPFFKINKIIKKIKPDIINICSPYPIGFLSRIFAIKNKIPFIGTIHTLPENMISPFFRFKNYKTICDYAWKYLIFYFNLFQIVIIPTQTGADMYKERGLKSIILPISNGLKNNVFNNKNNGEYLRKRFNLPKKNIVLYTGRINEEKNLDVLIKSIPFVLKKINAHFLLCGSGGKYRDDLIKLAQNLGVTKNITFTDFIDWEDYPNIYSIADVFVIPSEAELQSLVTLEAVASGLPIVVVNKGALHELASMNNGFTFESKNSEQMAEFIIKILSDEKLKKAMGKNSLELIKKHSIESVADQYEKVYEQVIENYKKKR